MNSKFILRLFVLLIFVTLLVHGHLVLDILECSPAEDIPESENESGSAGEQPKDLDEEEVKIAYHVHAVIYLGICTYLYWYFIKFIW